MCEQSGVQYLDAELVWVRLGPYWWPGEVCDIFKLLPKIIQGLKRQSIAIVKFFRKILNIHRAKFQLMDKLPADVCHAETFTGGDPDIIASDQFALEQKPSYAAILGTPSLKKTPKVGGGRRRLSSSTSKPSKSPATPRITHPRFVGKSDHEVRILEQTTPSPQASHYTCHICGFESTRLNVIVLHNKGHSNGSYVTPSKQKSRSSSTSSKNRKKAKSFASTHSIDVDLELICQRLTLSADDFSDSDTEQENGKKTLGKRKTTKSGNRPNKKAKGSIICNNLLADWSYSDSNEVIIDEPPTVIEKLTKNHASETAELAQDKTVANNNVHNELLADWEDKGSDDQTTRADSSVHKNETISLDKDNDMEKSSSCSDFKDEGDIKDLKKLPGRKIPRVNPPKRVPLDTDINIKYESRRNGPESTYEQLMGTCDKSTDESNKNTSQKPDLEAASTLTKVYSAPQSQLIPNSTLYPMNVSNVLESSLTLAPPIMTPLEMPSVNKKITSTDIESALIMPFLLELPVTITDPSISQTLSQQVMLGNDIQTNLELPITFSDLGIALIRSTKMSSPSFVYSLPKLDEGSKLGRKRVFPEITAAATAAISSDSIYNTALAGSMSMPLLTAVPEMPIVAEQTSTNHDDTAEVTPPETTFSETVVSESDLFTRYSTINTKNIQSSVTEKITNELQIRLTKEELDLIASDYCRSLSEPPPGLFDKSSFSFQF